MSVSISVENRDIELGRRRRRGLAAPARDRWTDSGLPWLEYLQSWADDEG
jgi:hypothetical protein